MAILVTGGCGYIGSHAVLALRDRGERVVVIDDLSSGAAAALPSGVPLAIGDVGDAALLRSIVRKHGVGEIIHFAARIVVPESVSDPLAYYEANVCKTRALVETAISCGIERIVFSSSAAVYGDPGPGPVGEQAETRPVSPYGRTKLMCEWMLQDAASAHGLGVVALRYFNVAGADPLGRAGQSSPQPTHLIKLAVRSALGAAGPIRILGTDYPTRDGTCLRDYVQVSDLADCHLAALDHLRSGGDSGAFNCGYGRGHSVREVIETVQRVAGVRLEIREAARRPGDPAALVACPDLARQKLAWRPRHADLEGIVRQALDWERHLAGGAAGPRRPARERRAAVAAG